MNQFLILLLVIITSASAYLLGIKTFGFPLSLRTGLGRSLETIGVVVLFFGVNVLVTVILVFSIRAFGIIVSLYLGTDPTLIGISLLQGIVFQFWRYSGTNFDQ